MDRFQYDILTGHDEPNAPGGVVWFLTSNMNQPLGPQLPLILNQLGAQGWELAAIGDIAFTGRPEIVMKKRIQ
jgi:hypothetical protein